MRFAGPMNSVGIGQFVGWRPDAEIWVARDQRNRWWTELFGVEIDRGEREREQNAYPSFHVSVRS